MKPIRDKYSHVKELKASIVLLLFLMSTFSFAQDQRSQPTLPQLIKQSQPGIVAIGLYTPLEAKDPRLLGSGFVIGDGKHIVTNYHVVATELRTDVVQRYVAIAGKGEQPQVITVELLAIDPVHDLAILSIDKTLTPLSLASDEFVDEGTDIYFIGFPIGAVLGYFPSTHQGIISAIAPDINPARNANELTIQMLARLKKPFMIYQLDATAFPGNSGSPVFSRDTGEVIAVINKVFVSAGKEAALSNPSGISYAIPVKHLRKLAKNNDIAL